ncbi:uncharacterized protein LOC130388261 [Gadus chalcogrammus]|uniref:uncharacterized protein LOC130388261 n=1 Tax=Gadus chalcogrammus TaxID=1042646 RepID=UPI0024C4BF23|nr:uncharacterized protein LOC130388261 [Gadus chalcogrammus]
MNQDTQALLDTGSAVTLLRPDLAGGKAGEPMEVACVHGDTRTYPTCHVVVRTTHGVFTIRAGIVPHLPVPVVIGRDCPIFRRGWDPVLESRGRREAVAVAAREAVAAAAREAVAVAARDAAGAAARGTQPAPQETPDPGEIPSRGGPSATWGLGKGWRSVASRHGSLGLDRPGVPWRTGCTTPTHQPAMESSPFGSPIRVIGGHLAESVGAILKGGPAQHSTGREQKGRARRTREQLEAHGGPRDRVSFFGVMVSS